ncbi:MAG: acyltransferase, partial [Ferruginibacter sp.]|nr:acyltransferase [Ferruginibacter sp.]
VMSINSNRKYYPQLDAIRGVGIICIFFYHAYKPNFGNTFIEQLATFFYSNLYLSIDLFFVLSSFLITYLALEEIAINGHFSIKNFFIRRILRIWPLYFFILCFAFLVVKNLANYYGQNISMPPASWYYLFLGNFYTYPHVFFLQQLWTISVEEQFYILWGISLFFFYKKIKWVMLFFALTSISFNLYSAITNKDNYFHSLTYLNEMMAGAYLAYAIRYNKKIIQYIKKLTIKYEIGIYLFIPLFFVTYFFLNRFFIGVGNNILYVIMRLIFITHSCVLVAHQFINVNSVFNLKKCTFFIYSGKISYGLYCYHGFVITFGTLAINKFKFTIHPFLTTILLLAITFFVATLSYTFLEKPFLKMKNKLGYSS